MEVWQEESFNLDFLSEFEFVRSTEETTANNDAVVPNSNLQPANLSDNSQLIPTISVQQEPEVDNNENDALQNIENNNMYQNNNNDPSGYDKDEQLSLLPWHAIIDELNRYNWQQDSENRVKLLLSHFETENTENSNSSNIDTKPECNETSLQIKEEVNSIDQNNLELYPNEIKLQLKMESNIIPPDTSYLTPPNYNSINGESSSSFLNLQQFKEEIPSMENEDSNSTMRNLMELDEMCSQIAAQSQDSVIDNNNINMVDWQENWQQNVITSDGNLDENNIETNSLIESHPVESHPSTDNDYTMIEQIEEWDESLKDAANKSTHTENWNVVNGDNNIQQENWQQPLAQGTEQTMDMALLLSQLQGEHLSTPSLLPNEAAESEDIREQRLPDWNTAFGHTRPVSIEDDFSTQPCDLFYKKDTAQDLCQVQSPVGVDLQPSPVSADTTIEEDTEISISPPITQSSTTPTLLTPSTPSPSTPTPTAPMPTAPMPTTPLLTTPMPTTPLLTTPMPTTLLLTTPMPTTPLLTTPLLTTPLPTTPKPKKLVHIKPMPTTTVTTPCITTSQLETTSVIETPEPTIDKTVAKKSGVENKTPVTVVNITNESQNLLQIDTPKPKKNGDPCQFCGKAIINLNRHFMRVHNMKKVNGVFVPFNVYNSKTPKFINDTVYTDTCSKEKNAEATVNTIKPIENIVSENPSKNKSPINSVSECSNSSVSSINMVRENIPETTNFSVVKENAPVVNTTSNENGTTIEKCVCALCNKVFKGKVSMAKHMKTIHKVTHSILKCKKCPYTTIYPYVMKNHINQKHSFKPSFICIYCDLTYKGREGVKHHIKTKHHVDVQSQFGELNLETVAKVINLCKSKCQNSPSKNVDSNTKQSSPFKACFTTIMPSRLNLLLPPCTVVSRVKDFCTARSSKNVNKSNAKTVLENKNSNIPIANRPELCIEATLSNPDLTVSVIPCKQNKTSPISPNPVTQPLNQDPIPSNTNPITAPKRKAPIKAAAKIKNKRTSVSALTSDVSISLEMPQIDPSGSNITQNRLPNISLFPISNDNTVKNSKSEIQAQTTTFEITSNYNEKRKSSDFINAAKKYKKIAAMTEIPNSPDSIQFFPASSPNSTSTSLFDINLTPFVPTICEEIQSHSSYEVNPEPIPDQEFIITANPKEILPSIIDENIINTYLNPNSIIPTEIINEKLTETSTCNPEETSCFSTIPDYILSSNEIQSYIINSPCQNPEPDSTSEIVNLTMPSTSSNSYNYVPSPSLLINNNEMLSSTCISNVNSPNTVSYSNIDYNFLPIDYAKKHIDPLSPLSPPSSCLSPSISLLPPSESCSSYTSIHSSELDAAEADSQKETSSFTYNDPSSNHSSTTSSNNSNKAIDFSYRSKRGEYPCKNCYKRFNSQDELNIHKNDAHNNLEKPYSCTICSYKCAHTAYLKRHMKTHEIHKCSYCSRKFIDQFLCESHKLAEHVDEMSNTEDEEEEEKQVVVEEEEEEKKEENVNVKSFSIKVQAQNEQKTIIVDTDDNMIDWDSKTCKICDRHYTQEMEFYVHLYQYHLYTQYLTTQCLFCNKTVKKKQYLKKHLKNVHKISFPDKK